MAVIGLTDKGAALPKIGDIRKGARKTDPKKPGIDLDYFRFVTDPDAARKIVEIFGDQPQAIEFISPFNTVAETFEAWKEEYGAGGLKHRCDGFNTVRRQLANGTYVDDSIPCPGNCNLAGRLYIIIPALNRLGHFVVHTSSIWDIISISQQLTMLETLRGSLRGIPLILKRVKRAISTPSGSNGQRARREKWLLSIEASPKWVELQLSAMEKAALPSATEPLMLTAGDMIKSEPDEENDEFEMMCDPETQEAIKTLWPEAGFTSGGKLMTIAAFLKSQKQPEEFSQVSQEYAQKLLTELQNRALKARHPEPPKAEPGAGLDQWACGDRALALDIIQLTEDLEKLGVDETAWRAELAITNGKPDDTRLSRKDLTYVEATAWRDTLKAWIVSKS